MKAFSFSVALLLLSANAMACEEPHVPTFRQSFSKATNIVVFRLVSLGLADQKEASRKIAGGLEPIQTLKGKNSFQYLTHDATNCGGLNLLVGHYYLVATQQSGTILHLTRGDKSILDVSDDFGQSYFPHPGARAVWNFEQAIKGTPIRKGLIRE